jgi:hypothetical protein
MVEVRVGVWIEGVGFWELAGARFGGSRAWISRSSPVVGVGVSRATMPDLAAPRSGADLAVAINEIRRRVRLRRWWFLKTNWALKRENTRSFHA